MKKLALIIAVLMVLALSVGWESVSPLLQQRWWVVGFRASPDVACNETTPDLPASTTGTNDSSLPYHDVSKLPKPQEKESGMTAKTDGVAAAGAINPGALFPPVLAPRGRSIRVIYSRSILGAESATEAQKNALAEAVRRVTAVIGQSAIIIDADGRSPNEVPIILYADPSCDITEAVRTSYSAIYQDEVRTELTKGSIAR